MKIKVAEYIAEFFATHGVKDCFMITGGGAMHLNDAFGHNGKINCIFNHHEQAAAIAAEGYARINKKPAVVCTTSGPGGTNALTGVMGAWVDSIPMFVISGQVKKETTVSACPELSLRQLGDQEYYICDVAEHMSKYAVMLKEPLDVVYELEKAYWLATTGRCGPVWIDVPLDVQSALIDPDKLLHFDEQKITDEKNKFSKFTKAELLASSNVKTVSCDVIKEITQKIKKAKAPAFLVGTGVHLADGEGSLLKILDKYKIPVLTAWNANDLVAFDDPYFAGMPGTVGTRCGNFVLQNCDLLISLGCRMNIRMTGYTHFDFAKNAEIISVDIDSRELKKPTLNIETPIHADLRDFMPRFLEEDYLPSSEEASRHAVWLSWCKDLLKKFPSVLPEYHDMENEAGNINPYVFVENLFDYLKPSDKIVCGNGSACVITFQAAKIKQGQRMFTNSGCATMGYGLPAAVGAAFAVKRKDNENDRIVCIDGDGSIMMNLQELATVAHHKLNIKIFLINNNGYHSMRQTQRNLFDGDFIGVGPKTGLSFPDFKKLSEAFGIEYMMIKNEAQSKEIISCALEKEGPMIIEVMADPAQDFAPKISSRINEDGSITSATLSDMAPFMDRAEYESIRYM